MRSNDKLLVIVPNPLPVFFNTYCKNWKNWVRTNHGHYVTLRYAPSCATGGDGWMVTAPILIPRPNSSWLPTAWLGERPCDCAIDELLRNGCPIIGHV